MQIQPFALILNLNSQSELFSNINCSLIALINTQPSPAFAPLLLSVLALMGWSLVPLISTENPKAGLEPAGFSFSWNFPLQLGLLLLE